MSFLGSNYTRRVRNLLFGKRFASGPVDPFFDNVTLLLPFTLSADTSLMVDRSKYADTKVSANPAFNFIDNTVVDPFGNLGVFKMTRDNRSQVWTNARFNRNNNEPISVEWWFNVISQPSAQSNNPRWMLWYDSNTATSFFIASKSPVAGDAVEFRWGTDVPIVWGYTASPPGPPYLNRWSFAQLIINAANVAGFYIDGALVQNTFSPFPPVTSGPFASMEIGFPNNATNAMNALLSNFRVTRGIARPVGIPTAPFPTR